MTDSTTTIPTDDAVQVAAALLMAAITLRDLCSAFSPQAMAQMPTDIRNRVTHHRYQEAFDQCSQRIQLAARRIVDADPDIIAARAIDTQEH